MEKFIKTFMPVKFREEEMYIEAQYAKGLRLIDVSGNTYSFAAVEAEAVSCLMVMCSAADTQEDIEAYYGEQGYELLCRQISSSARTYLYFKGPIDVPKHYYHSELAVLIQKQRQRLAAFSLPVCGLVLIYFIFSAAGAVISWPLFALIAGCVALIVGYVLFYMSLMARAVKLLRA